MKSVRLKQNALVLSLLPPKTPCLEAKTPKNKGFFGQFRRGVAKSLDFLA